MAVAVKENAETSYEPLAKHFSKSVLQWAFLGEIPEVDAPPLQQLRGNRKAKRFMIHNVIE